MSCLIPNDTRCTNQLEDQQAFLSDSGELSYIRDITHGGMSKILLYSLSIDGNQTEVAVKTLFKKSVSSRDLAHLKTEADILSSIDHENVIRIYGITKTYYGFGLILEYLPTGSYSDYFQNFREIAGNANNCENEIAPLKIRIIGEIVSAMEYLHRPSLAATKGKRILHLDLKGANVLLTQDLHAKICDFGLSMLSTLTKLRKGTTTHGGASGTSGYIAPERLRNVKCQPNTKCDVYSFGILQYEILTDLPPYPDFDESDLKLLAYHVTEKNYRPDVSRVPSSFPIELLNLMEQCWSPLPELRPPFSEISKRMTVVKSRIPDFERQASYSANIVTEILANEIAPYSSRLAIGSLPDIESFSSWPIRSEDRSSYEKTTSQHDVEDIHNLTNPPNETTVKNILSNSTERLLHYDPMTKLPIARSYYQQANCLSKTYEKVPISVAQADTEPRNQNSGNDNPPPVPFVTPNENFKYWLAKIFSVLLIVVVVAIITTVTALRPWNSSHDRTACRSPQITNGKVTCTDQTFEGSTCYFSCQNGHVIQGNLSIFCQANGNWSGPVASCECRNCNMGDRCQYDIKWQGIDYELSNVAGDTERALVMYGDYPFSCSAKQPEGQINPNYVGKCEDGLVRKAITVKCSGGFYNAELAAKAAAAAFIRELVKQRHYPTPCDSERMPNDC